MVDFVSWGFEVAVNGLICCFVSADSIKTPMKKEELHASQILLTFWECY